MSTQITIPKLSNTDYAFPDASKALKEGLLAWGGDLSPERLLQAYRQGIFPWYSKNDPILWWSPDPRLILKPAEFKVSKSLKKSRKKFSVHVNRDFISVINLCKKIREENKQGTWISDAMIEAYVTLHHLGYAKSIECYEQDELVGGLYGIVIGSVFCGESMFSKKTDASKVALWYLCELMKDIDGAFIDCQNPTKHLQSLGAKCISRKEFLKKLSTCRDKNWEVL